MQQFLLIAVYTKIVPTTIAILAQQLSKSQQRQFHCITTRTSSTVIAQSYYFWCFWYTFWREIFKLIILAAIANNIHTVVIQAVTSLCNMFIVYQGLWKWVYITKENFSNLAKTLVWFRIVKEHFIRWGIYKLKNTSYHTFCLLYFLMKTI